MASLFSPSTSVVVTCLVMVTLLVSPTSSRPGRRSRCLRSCVRCKEMFGQFFLGHLCAEACTARHGNFRAVCTDIHSIRPFLDLERLIHYDFEHVES